MIVSVSVGTGKEVSISVGDGKQTFKWLASVILARIKHFGVLKTSYENPNYIIGEMRNGDGELLNPNDMIMEHADGSGLSVEAKLLTEYPLDEYEVPELPVWMKGAYLRSKHGIDYATKLEELRSGGKPGDLSPADDSSLIKIGFNFSTAEADSAFELDWQSMKWTWLEDRLPKSILGATIRGKYALICNIFSHYCGVGQLGQRYGLSIHEFGHLMHSLGVCNINDSMELVEEVYYRTGQVASMLAHPSSSAASAGKDALRKCPLMTRAHLTEAFVCVAIGDHSVDSSDTSDSPRDGLEAFFSEVGPLRRCWDLITREHLLYTCPDRSLKAVVQQFHHLLKSTFQSNASIDSKYGPILPVSRFVDMIIKSSIVEPTARALCMSAFEDTQLTRAKAWQLQHLVFCDFIEALSRIAVEAINHDKNMDAVKRIRMAYNMIAELIEDDARSHK